MTLLGTPIGQFFIDPRDEFVAKELQLTGDYQPQERALYFQLLKPTDNVLWLGAHIGALLLPISRVVNAAVAFEANPKSYKLLKKNIEVNERNNITAYNLAVSSSYKKLEFLANVVNSGGSKRMPKKMEPMYLDEGTELIEVDAVPIDVFLKKKKFDFIFMDIEGSEYAALTGMPEAISECRVLVSEFIPHHLKNVAGVTPDQFLEPLADFTFLHVPELQRSYTGPAIRQILNDMFNKEVGSSGLIFFNDHIGGL